jgi:RHS repeat-associated protein
MKEHGGEVKQSYGFTGREWDKETGLYYYRARYYDPKGGRFISKDPIGFEGGDVNLYRYVGNDPVDWVDPSGLFCGSGISEIFIPDSFGRYNFAKACEAHDNCYGECGSSKNDCDSKFQENMYKECDTLNGLWKTNCKSVANSYHNAVKNLGANPFKKAQQKNTTK